MRATEVQRESVMFTTASLLDIHARTHRNLAALIDHCRQFDADALNREWEGFGYPSIRLQFIHELGAERYWLGVLEGRIDADDDAPLYPTLDDVEALRKSVAEATATYLRGRSDAELSEARTFSTWGGRQQVLAPGQVLMRIVTHIFHHQGQINAMCRLSGRPANRFDYPLD